MSAQGVKAVVYTAGSSRSPSRAWNTARAARSKDLLGVQPKLTQVPPVRFRSARATVCPALAAVIAAVRPHGPPPTTSNSYMSLGRGGRQSVGWPWAIVRRFGASKGRMLGADMSHLVWIVVPEPDRPAEPPAGPPLAEHHAQQRRQRFVRRERLVEQQLHSVRNKKHPARFVPLAWRCSSRVACRSTMPLRLSWVISSGLCADLAR